MLSGLTIENGSLVAKTKFGEPIKIGDSVFYQMHGGSSFLYMGTKVTKITESGVTVTQPSGDNILLDPYNVYVNRIPQNKTIINLSK